MNEEPGWLRSDAAARAREVEHDDKATKARRGTVAREQDPGLVAEASRALAAGQPGKLRAGAVMHLQRTAGNAGVTQFLGEERESDSAVKGVVGHGSGAPLEEASRERMEASFGADFADVRVHTDGAASASAQAVNAHAYTVGNEVVLGDGQTPGSPAYERTLAHELTHVVQQRSGPVDGTPTAGGISVSDPADRFEQAAESTADAVVGTGRVPDAGAGGAAAGGSIQREEGSLGDEEEEIQALAIQRAGREEEPEETAAGVEAGQAGPAGEAQAAEVAAEVSQEAAEETAPAAQDLSEKGSEEEQEEAQLLAIQREVDPGDERVLR